MKKILIGLLIGAAPFMLTACGSKKKKKKDKKESSGEKTIICTGDAGEGKLTVTVKYNEKTKTIGSSGMKYVLDVSSYSEEEMNTLKGLDLCDSFKNDETFSSCKSINDGSNFGVDLTYDIAKLKSELYLEKEEFSADELVKAIEEEMDAKCEVK